MKLAFHTHGWGPKPFDAAIGALSRIGYAGLEIAPAPATLPPSAWTIAEAWRLRALAEAAGLRIANLDLGHAFLLSETAHEPSFMAPYADQRDQRLELIHGSLAFAAELGAPMVSIPSGRLPPHMSRDAAIGHLIDGVDACLAAASKHNVALAIEPVCGHLIGSYPAYLELRQIFAGGNFGLCYDLAEAHGAYEDIAAVIAEATDLRHLHLCDAAGREAEHLIPDEGKLDLAAIFRQLTDAGYSGFVSIELAKGSGPEEDGARKAFSALGNCSGPAVGKAMTAAQSRRTRS